MAGDDPRGVDSTLAFLSAVPRKPLYHSVRTDEQVAAMMAAKRFLRMSLRAAAMAALAGAMMWLLAPA
jgi:hypothetical protein